MTPELAVVIPYFQREPGILRETLRHVFGQRNAPAFQLIVVDDGSPAPADSELADLTAAQRAQVSLIRQSNGGVAAACNTGLAAVAETAEWIARLDSDDHWHPDHLADAVMMLRAGFDFFFANEIGAEGIPRLEHCGFQPSEHLPRPEGPHLFEMQGDAFLRMMVRHAQVCTSSVVMRRSKFRSLRYRKTYAMCDDMHLFLDIAMQSPRVAFTSDVHVFHGPGLHVNQVRDWKTNRALLTACDFIDYYARILREVDLSPAEEAMIRQHYQTAQFNVSLTALAMLGAGRLPDLRVAFEVLPRHPGLLRELVRVVARRVVPREPAKP